MSPIWQKTISVIALVEGAIAVIVLAVILVLLIFCSTYLGEMLGRMRSDARRRDRTSDER